MAYAVTSAAVTPMRQQPSKMESFTASANSTIKGGGGAGTPTISPDKSSSGPSPAIALPRNKSGGGEKKIMSPDRRQHYRSSSLENNIFMSNLSPFTGHNHPQQQHLHHPHAGSGASTPANIANNMAQLSIAATVADSPSRTDSLPATSPSPASSRRRYQPLAPSSPQYPSLQQQPQQKHHHQSQQITTPPTSINNGEMHGHLKSSPPLSLSSPATYQLQSGATAALGGHPTTTAYYGTLKSKREQKRMQMNSQKAGMGAAAAVGVGHQYLHHHSNGFGGGAVGVGGGLQARISSVDDLRPGHSNSISKSQVRLMRDMFEQQQQQQQQNNGSSGTSKAAPKRCEGSGNGSGNSSSSTQADGAALDEVPLSKPPAIQPCLGVVTQQQLIKPIAFKPIPFPADSRFNSSNLNGNGNPHHYEPMAATTPHDRYGSTPSLNPPINYNLKFGSTHDLRQLPPHHLHHHNFNTVGSRKAYAYNSLHNYDSMESISPDSICSSQSTLKSISQYHADLLDTPSPSDSGISELEAALRDRDSELAYLRHTMEHNEKVIFRVHQDKERNWEEEVKRMRAIHGQRIQKFEQIAMMQSFQLRQAKKRHQEEATQSQERIKDLERKVELQSNELRGHKVSDKELREQCADTMEENGLLRKLVSELRSRLEESEWTNCQKNGETALLKTQLREAHSEGVAKDQEIAHLRRIEATIKDHLVLPANDSNEPPIIITTTTHPSVSSSSSSSSSSSGSPPLSINHSDDEKLKDDLQFSHLNRIVILKDQIIMAMTNEIQKLRKEVSELGLLNSYDGLPPGRGPTGGKGSGNEAVIGGGGGEAVKSFPSETPNNNNKMYSKDNGDYHDLLNNLKNSEELKNALLNNQFGSATQSGAAAVREKVAINHLTDKCDEKPVGGGSSERKRTNLEAQGSGDDDDEMAKLRTELAAIKHSFDAERKKWTEEKEKVLVYQRQLQRNYLQMCKRNENLEQRLQKNTFKEVAI